MANDNPMNEETNSQAVTGTALPAADPPKIAVARAAAEVSEEQAAEVGLPSSAALNYLYKFAAQMVNTPFLPKGLNTPGAVVAAILTGREMQFRTMESLRAFWQAPDGRLGMYAEWMLAKMRRAGIKIRPVVYSDEAVSMEFTRPEEEPVVFTWTMEDAQRAKLTERGGLNTWLKYPRRMLRARVVSEAFTFLGGDIEGGTMLSAEELQDMADEPASQPEVIEPPVAVGTRRKETATVVNGPVREAAAQPPGGDYPPNPPVIVPEPPAPPPEPEPVPVVPPPPAPPKPPAKKAEPPRTRVEPPPPPAATPEAPPEAMDINPLRERAKGLYEALPVPLPEKKTTGDSFCNGWFNAAIPREWPKNIPDRTAVLDALDWAIRNRPDQLRKAARQLGREMKLGQFDHMRAVMKDYDWGEETAKLAIAVKTKTAWTDEDFRDWVTYFKGGITEEEDAQALMRITLVVGRGDALALLRQLALAGDTYGDILRSLEKVLNTRVEDMDPNALEQNFRRVLERQKHMTAGAGGQSGEQQETLW